MRRLGPLGLLFFSVLVAPGYAQPDSSQPATYRLPPEIQPVAQLVEHGGSTRTINVSPDELRDRFPLARVPDLFIRIGAPTHPDPAPYPALHFQSFTDFP